MSSDVKFICHRLLNLDFTAAEKLKLRRCQPYNACGIYLICKGRAIGSKVAVIKTALRWRSEAIAQATCCSYLCQCFCASSWWCSSHSFLGLLCITGTTPEKNAERL